MIQMHASFVQTRPNSVRFLFVGLDEERSLQKKVDTRDKFWMLLTALRLAQTNNS